MEWPNSLLPSGKMKILARQLSAKIALIIGFSLIISCNQSDDQLMPEFDIQGHRGCRGLLPENTIYGFLRAIELGVTTIELDVVISADDRIVVSHEAFFNPDICIDKVGQELDEEINIYQLNYSEIVKYDCGSKQLKQFPMQENRPASKPLLSEVIKEAEKISKGKIQYNIELKSSPEGDNISHPIPEIFTKMVLQEINAQGINKRTTIQSFDPRILEEAKRQASEMTIALLIEESIGMDEDLALLTFKPDIYSPYSPILDKAMINELHESGIRVIPWTINSVIEMDKLMDMGVDGIITDYPDRLVELVLSRKEESKSKTD